MKRRLISLLLALALSIGLVLPAYAETAATENTEVVHLDTCLENCALEDCACECHQAAEHTHDEQTHAEGCADDCAVEGCACECHVVTETPTEETVQHVTMCGGENCLITDCSCQCHAEPEVTEEPTEAPSEEATEAPSEEPTEAVTVDAQKLYEDILATTHLFDADALLDALTEEQMAAFVAALTQEQIDAIDAHFNALIEAYESEVPAETEPVVEGEVDVESEIHYVTKDVTNAAPFLAPVEGEAPAVFGLLRAVALAEEETDNGLSTDKYVDENEDGSYTLTLEAFATGAKTTTTVTSTVPTDIILVLDQSGSMDDDFSSVAYRATSGTPVELYNDRSNLYVKLSDNKYADVTVTRTQVSTGSTYTAYANQQNSTYYSSDNRNNLYHKCDDDTYGKITVSRTGQNNNRRYTYTCANCGTLISQSQGNNTRPSGTTEFYLLSTTQVYQYTFTYTNAEGTVVTESVLATDAAPAWDFYESYTSGTTTRLAALKTAVTTFANNVATQAKGTDGVLGTDDDVNHTISVVGFANYSNYDDYNNTEVFVGRTGYKYGAAARGQYANAPQDMNTETGVSNVTASINALDADGATYIDLGIEMANGILNANPVPTGEKRNRVVVIFTDGVPGYSGSYGDQSYGSTGANAQAVADAAMTQIAITKNTHGATVYTVGIFTGADATSAGSNANNASATQRANYFMQRLSSNTAYPQTPSYYLSASDSAALTSIFKSISENIESGGSSITLNEEAVLKDVITEQFVLPEGASASDIKVYTADYIAADTFADPVAFNATVEIGEDGRTITVTNFDYAENWVGTETAADGTVTYRGKKLIIEIPIEVRDGFIGGNGVYTNASGSGIYENADAEEPLEEFISPTVDVEISAVTVVTAPDHNVYLLGGVTAEQLENALTVTVGDVTLDMDAENYGLEDWQYAYVTMGDEATMTTYTNLTEDATYTATVTVEPKTEGTATAKSGSNTGNINVFKPVITFQDTGINVGETADYADNFVSVEWKHGETVADTTAMGEAPALTYSYDIPAGAFTADTKVSVTVNMGETDVTNYVTFEHEDCAVENITCTWIPAEDDGVAGAEFIVHIKSFDLTITKTGANETLDPGQTFIFYITGPNGFSKTVIIEGNGSVTIAGLPVGTYTIEEDTSWSWRYTCTNAEQTVTAANVSNGAAKVTFVNERTDDQWLDGNTIAENIFDVLQN